MNKTIDRLATYFDKMVPATGKADTVAGEIVRALNKIGYRYYNDGDQVGVEYGNETCNAPARYLIEKLPNELKSCITALWGKYWCNEKGYEIALNEAINKVLDWLDTTDLTSKTNTEDMLDYEEPEDSEWCDEDYESDLFEDEDYEDIEDEDSSEE